MKENEKLVYTALQSKKTALIMRALLFLLSEHPWLLTHGEEVLLTSGVLPEVTCLRVQITVGEVSLESLV